MERHAARGVPPASIGEDADAGGPPGVREVIRQAATGRRACRIGYLKASGTRPESREIEPWVLVHAERWWYVLGPDHRDGVVRFFRLDRILSAELLERKFLVPPDFDVAEYLSGGRALVAGHAATARVRYTSAAAPYVREQWPDCAEGEDGGVEAVHPLLEPGWALRHVLQYGPDAQVVDPPELAATVARTARSLAEDWSLSVPESR
jgi:predicted DNA-binding transcriptional regulator YafY